MGKLRDRVAVVTGGQRGLGAATIRELAGEGAICVVNYPNKMEADAAQQLVGALREEGREIVAIAADVSDAAQVTSMFNEVQERFGRLDILVNNAGVNPLRSWDELDDETFKQTLMVNVAGVFYCCRAALALMRQQEKGNIVNIASVAAFIGRGNVDYISSKAALIGLTRSLARQYGKFGIRANCVSPGFHNSDMTQRARQTSTESADEFIKTVPLGFLAEADSIGKAVLFLCSDDSYYITGHNLVVDGGLTLR